MNILRHRLPRPVVEEVAKKRGIVLSPDQLQAFDFLNKEEKPVMLIKALAGTGKSTIATIIVEALYENKAPRDKNEAVVILGPSRQLRDEHTLDTHFITQADSSMAKDLCVKVLWLGREADQGLLPTWDQQMWAKVKTMLAKPIKNLKDRGCQGRGAGLLCVPELRTYNGGVLRSGVAGMNVERGRSTFVVARCKRRRSGWRGANVERGRSTFGVAGCELRTGAFYVRGGGART